MKVSICDEGLLQCASDTCTTYCPKYEDCIDLPDVMADAIREIAKDGKLHTPTT